jgi:hypothetical protein
MKLPKGEQHLEEWQAATEALLMAAENRGPLMHARIGMLRALNRHVERVFDPSQRQALGKAEVQEGPNMTVLIYVNTSKEVGDSERLKVFARADAAETWLQENDPEGAAFDYEVLE